MKKLIALLCTVSMLATLGACGENETSSDISESSVSTSESETEETTKELVTETTTQITENITENETKEQTFLSNDIKTTTAVSETSVIESDVKSTTSNAEEIQIETEEAETDKVTINSSSEFVSAIEQQIEITNIIPTASEMIGAIDGTSFVYNGNKFEIYLFDENSEKISEALSGKLSFTIDGFGEFSSEAIVNGNYVMIFNTADDTVNQIFLNIK